MSKSEAPELSTAEAEQVARFGFDQPSVPGWYRTVPSTNWMLYALDAGGNWSAHVVNGEATPCAWSYIDQAGPVALVAPLTVGCES